MTGERFFLDTFFLVERQRAWETRPHARLGGRTPVDVIPRERRGER